MPILEKVAIYLGIKTLDKIINKSLDFAFSKIQQPEYEKYKKCFNPPFVMAFKRTISVYSDKENSPWGLQNTITQDLSNLSDLEINLIFGNAELEINYFINNDPFDYIKDSFNAYLKTRYQIDLDNNFFEIWKDIFQQKYKESFEEFCSNDNVFFQQTAINLLELNINDLQQIKTIMLSIDNKCTNIQENTEEILERLQKIPDKFLEYSDNSLSLDWNKHSFANELSIAMLLGSWDENSEAGRIIVSKLAKDDYNNWILKLREILQESECPISLKNGVWSVKDRKNLYKSIAARIFDETLDIFQQCSVSVLSELDPKFEMKEEEHFSASIYGKVLKHSNCLRKGLSEGLAIIACNTNSLINCSIRKAETTVTLSIREIFNNSSWVTWASLNSLLPLLAETAPDEFLNAVETTLKETPTNFIRLFPKKEAGIMSNNYIVGLLWSLEILAWDERFLVRITIILGELACIDPGSNWSNRPSNSLIEIFLPWHTQTTAPLDKKKAAINTLNKELPDICWNLLINLLPNRQQIASGSHKPIWRNFIPADWPEKISNKEYWEQVEFYTDLAVELDLPPFFLTVKT